MDSLKYILFEKQYPLHDEEIGVLFASQRQLADEIQKIGTYKTVESVTTILSKVLKSEQTPTKHLIDQIIKVSSVRLAPSAREHFSVEFHSCFKNTQNHKSIDFTWESLKEWSETADNHYIFTNSPAETRWEYHDIAKELTSQLYEHITNAKDIPVHHFFFPKFGTAVNFWMRLHLYISRELVKSDEIANEILIKANETGKLNVMLVDESECVIPLSYLERKGERTVFILSFHSYNTSSICQLADSDVNNWFQERFSKLIYSRDNKKPEPVPFKQILERRNIFHFDDLSKVHTP